MYRLTLARTPRAEEGLRALNYVNKSLDATGGASGRPVEAWAGLCHALLASAEFRYLN